MGNKNYTKYSQNSNSNANINFNEVVTEPVTTPEVVTEPVTTPEVVTEPVTTPPAPDFVVGTVVNCARLNVRKEPSKESEVIGILNKDDSVDVYLEESTDDFYKIVTMTMNGYCVKDFISYISVK